jgi:hypothetical protein
MLSLLLSEIIVINTQTYISTKEIIKSISFDNLWLNSSLPSPTTQTDIKSTSKIYTKFIHSNQGNSLDYQPMITQKTNNNRIQSQTMDNQTFNLNPYNFSQPSHLIMSEKHQRGDCYINNSAYATIKLEKFQIDCYFLYLIQSYL